LISIAKTVCANTKVDLANEFDYSLSTNIEFLKRICKSPAFIAGEVETGYITKYKEELFAAEPIETEAYAQAALGLLMTELRRTNSFDNAGPHGNAIGFAFNSERGFELMAGNTDPIPVTVSIKQTGQNKFDIMVKSNGAEEIYLGIISESKGSSITTFFPHTRIETTLITQDNKLTIFQHGKQIQLVLATPQWQEKALGLKDVTNSVLAPMPCKILRTEVQEGDAVEKDQALVVIESMKMETVIRSPQKGIIAKMAHKQGDICKAGTVLVLFEEPE